MMTFLDNLEAYTTYFPSLLMFTLEKRINIVLDADEIAKKYNKSFMAALDDLIFARLFDIGLNPLIYQRFDIFHH